MKIGILTHHYVKNFGAYMQACALVNTIKQIYPDALVELIDYRVKKHELVNIVHFFGFKPKRGDSINGWLSKIALLFTHQKYESNLPKSKKVFSADDINKIKYDLIIVGSDEVWNYNDIAFSAIKFGVGIEGSIITYSASVGGSYSVEDIADEVIYGINKFQAISVRDSKSQELVDKLTDKVAIRTLDPVYLYEYCLDVSEKIKKLVQQQPYILIYDCHLTPKQVRLLQKYAKDHQWAVLGAGEYRNWYSSTSTVNITPFEWAYLFKNAQAVITGTFHGTSFAIKYNKKFVSFLTELNRVNKVESLLKEFQLTSQILKVSEEDEIIQVMERNIDYTVVNALVENKVQESKRYLFDQINACYTKKQR